MAPNLITLIGLSTSFFGYILLYVYCPNLTSHEAPKWVLPVVGLCLFLYQTLDNMDGKVRSRFANCCSTVTVSWPTPVTQLGGHCTHTTQWVDASQTDRHGCSNTYTQRWFWLVQLPFDL